MARTATQASTRLLALAMLSANRYISHPGPFRSYSVIWRAGA